MKIPFNQPLMMGNENTFLTDVLRRGKFSAFGHYNDLCSKILRKLFKGTQKVYMTSSCTTAMEMAALLAEIKSGDEVIIPSFTHVGTANPFLRAGAEIVWNDINSKTMNFASQNLEDLITTKTKAIVVVHYAGIACEIAEITSLCHKHNILLIEDCAMALGSSLNNIPLGTFGDLAVTSFHETKNIHCGEGGALIVNRKKFIQKAEILINCGTNKGDFDLGKSDNYSWIAKSSNFKMSELQAAFLFSQLEHLTKVNSKRLSNWQSYYHLFSQILPKQNLPFVPRNAIHNGHLFYIHTSSKSERQELIAYLHENEIETVFHYIPLHNAPIWHRSNTTLPVTERKAETILRLPLYFDLTIGSIVFVMEKVSEFYANRKNENK